MPVESGLAICPIATPTEHVFASLALCIGLPLFLQYDLLVLFSHPLCEYFLSLVAKLIHSRYDCKASRASSDVFTANAANIKFLIIFGFAFAFMPQSFTIKACFGATAITGYFLLSEG